MIKEMPHAKLAAIYARVSSDQQKDEQTIGSQIVVLQEYAQVHGYTIPAEWIFKDEGYSGTLLVRPALERLRDLAAEGQIQTILILSPDRLSRKYAFQVLLLEEFSRHGVEIIFIKSPVATTPEEQLLVQFQGMIAEYERAQIVERSRRGKRYRAKTGVLNVLSGAPYGYRYIKKTESSAAYYEVLEEQAVIVRNVYAWYIEEGISIGAIARRLNEQEVPTRSGRCAWERSMIWAMLRNPAYKGTACFGKTESAKRTHITRPIRLKGGFSKRDSSHRERPREEWIEIPVPAIVSANVFDLAQQRLQSNKHFSIRHTLVPTLLQGMLVCRECGYGFYRVSTRKGKKKTYYYRCFGTNRYRRPKAPCTNRPIRQDYLDPLLWNHAVQLLKNPDLIRAEINRRVQEVQSSNPTKMRKDVLLREMARIQKSINRVLDAYQEGLFPLEQLRHRIPELKKRETALKGELQSLETSVMDQQKCNELAGSLEDFLHQLEKSADTLDVKSRQKIFRLIVKEVLIGRETVTIRHSIPTGSSTTLASGSAPSGPPETPSYLLRGRRDHTTLRCA